MVYSHINKSMNPFIHFKCVFIYLKKNNKKKQNKKKKKTNIKSMSVELRVVVLPDCSLSNLYHLTDMIAKN